MRGCSNNSTNGVNVRRGPSNNISFGFIKHRVEKDERRERKGLLKL